MDLEFKMEKSKKKISSKFLTSPEILNRYFIGNQNNEMISLIFIFKFQDDKEYGMAREDS